MKKIITIALVIFGLALSLPIAKNAQAATNLHIGSQCDSNSQCISGDCEKSAKKDDYGNNMWFCDCDEISYATSEDCTAEYGHPSDGGDWQCIDGGDVAWDLDYCLSTNKREIRFPIPTNGDPGFLTGRFFDPTASVVALQTKLADDINDSIKIKIPGLKFTKLENTLDTQGYINIPWLGEYIKAVYNYILGIVSIVAIIMIVIQGVRIVISGGGEQKNEAYKKIGHVAIGLVIAWTSYAILYTVNPDLVKFGSIRVKYVLSQPLPPEDIGEGITGNEAAPETIDKSLMADLSSVQALNVPAGQTRYARQELITDLNAALADYNHSIGERDDAKTVSVNSSFRSASTQYDLMKEYCGCPPETSLPDDISNRNLRSRCGACDGCRASCSASRSGGQFAIPPISHFGGFALDLSTKSSAHVSCDGGNLSSEEKQSKGVLEFGENSSNECVPREQQLLIKAMLDHNFCVGLKSGSKPRESWHFEYTEASTGVSTFCVSDKTEPNLQKLYYLQH